MDEEPPKLHYGLDIAQAKATLHKSNYELMMQWAVAGIRGFNIKPGTPNYDVLLQAPAMFEVTDIKQRQLYFHWIYEECLKNVGKKQKQIPDDYPDLGPRRYEE